MIFYDIMIRHPSAIILLDDVRSDDGKRDLGLGLGLGLQYVLQ